MNKQINFEDNIFMLNARIRMIRDLLRLDTDTELFMEKTLEDMAFLDTALEFLTKNLIESAYFLDRERIYDHLSDTEWQFSQIVTEITGDASSFPAEMFPEIRNRILPLRRTSETRRRTLDQYIIPTIKTQGGPVVTSLELNELLRDF